MATSEAGPYAFSRESHLTDVAYRLRDRCLGVMLATRESGFEVGPLPFPESRWLPDARYS